MIIAVATVVSLLAILLAVGFVLCLCLDLDMCLSLIRKAFVVSMPTNLDLDVERDI